MKKEKAFDHFKKVTSLLNKIYPNKIHFVTVGKYNKDILRLFPKNTTHYGLVNNEKKLLKYIIFLTFSLFYQRRIIYPKLH